MSDPVPVRSLRDWLGRLGQSGRLSVARPGIGLRHEAAAVANRLDGQSATLFPRPGGRHGTIVSGLVSSRAWMAEALGTREDRLIAHFQRACAEPLPWREHGTGPAQEMVHRSDIDILRIMPVPTLNEHDSGPYISAA